jgi:transitional endoplasmic reticulum ATPase
MAAAFAQRMVGLRPETSPSGRLSALTRLYVVVAVLFCGLYGASALFFLRFPDFAESGPGDLAHALASGVAVPTDILAAVKRARSTFPFYEVAAVRVTDSAGSFWVLYDVRPTGSISSVNIVDESGRPMSDAARIKAAGVWPNYGLVKNSADWITGFFALVGVAFAIIRWAPLSAVRGALGARERPRSVIARFFASNAFVFAAIFVVVGLPFLWFAPGWNRWRKAAWQYRWTAGFVGVVLAAFVIAAWFGLEDLAARVATTTIVVATAALWLFGWILLRPAGLARAEEVAGGRIVADVEPSLARDLRGAALPAPPAFGPAAFSGAASGQTLRTEPTGTTAFAVVPPERCPTFDQVGGMEEVKQKLRETVGLLLAFPDEALNFKVAFNGVLLYGPPGTGKTFLARATAGEFGCNFISIGSAEIISAYRGQSAKRIDDAFDFASANPPCVLFFDEFDALARRRQENLVSGEDRQTLDQLLRALERVRNRPEIIVMAATNDLDALDPAVIRPGRFDVRVRIDLPDSEARAAILKAQLTGRPIDSAIDYRELAHASDGLSAAAISAAVDRAALSVLGAVSGGDTERRITQNDVLAAFKATGGQDRPTAAEWTWEPLVLADTTKRELQELQRLIEEPDRARRFGITPPTGALLYGPPGTGKTTIARVLAAQAKTSFYPIKGSDIISKWVGQSEQNIAQLFARARENKPSIIFLDEVDAIAPRRSAGVGGSFIDRTVNQLLQEIDGLGSTPGVFVLGATNRPDMLDDALLRGGRLGRKIEIPLPDHEQRVALLRQFVARMPISADLDIEMLSAQTSGFSGADLQAWCQEAAVQSLMRQGDSPQAEITRDDFDAALQARKKGSR